MHNFHSLMDVLHQVRYEDPRYFLLLLLIPVVLLAAKFRRNTFGHSQVGLQSNIKAIPFLSLFPVLFAITLIGGLAVVGSQPYQTHIVNPHLKTRNYVVQVDISSSMSTALSDPALKDFASKGANEAKPKLSPDLAEYLRQLGVIEDKPAVLPASTPSDDQGEDGEDSAPKGPTRAMAARQGVKLFLDHRIVNTDRVALLTFDTRVYFSEPLGFNLKSIYNKLDDILFSGGGTEFEADCIPGVGCGAIQGAINHFKQATKPDDAKVLIMVTDGEDSMHPERIEALTRQIQQLHIKMYVIGVGESWLKPEAPDLGKFVESEGVNGMVMKAGNAQQLRDGFAEIDKLEAKDTQVTGTIVKQQYYPICALFTALMLIGLLIARAVVQD